jgi:hypothetical protein
MACCTIADTAWKHPIDKPIPQENIKLDRKLTGGHMTAHTWPENERTSAMEEANVHTHMA